MSNPYRNPKLHIFRGGYTGTVSPSEAASTQALKPAPGLLTNRVEPKVQKARPSTGPMLPRGILS